MQRSSSRLGARHRLATRGAACRGGHFVPVTDAMLRNPDPADWLMWRRTYDDWGYSPLHADRPRATSRSSRMVWSKDSGRRLRRKACRSCTRASCTSPSRATSSGHGARPRARRVWQYRRGVPTDVGRYVPNPHTNRNLAIYGRLIIDNGSDDYALRRRRRDGQARAGRREIVDYKLHPAKQGSGPIVVDGKLISGRNCMPQGGPEACVITAHDALDGQGALAPAHDSEAGRARRRELGRACPTRSAGTSAPGCCRATIPSSTCVYIGTSVTAPAPKFMLAGNDKKYLYHNSTLALDPDTGKIVWYYQHLVDHWDLDHPFERMLVDTAVAPDPTEVPWINPPAATRRAAQGHDGHPGQDRHRLHARPRDRRVPLGASRRSSRTSSRTSTAPRARSRRIPRRISRRRTRRCFVCPTTNGGKNWPGRRLQPAHQPHVLPAGEHLHEHDLDRGQGEARDDLRARQRDR